MSGTSTWKLIRDSRIGDDPERVAKAHKVLADTMAEVKALDSSATVSSESDGPNGK